MIFCFYSSDKQNFFKEMKLFMYVSNENFAKFYVFIDENSDFCKEMNV